jgi:hypothetical protein
MLNENKWNPLEIFEFLFENGSHSEMKISGSDSALPNMDGKSTMSG